MVAVMPPTLLAPDTDFVPSRGARQNEFRAYGSMLRLIGRPVPQPPPGDAAPVILVPGFIAGDASLALLARHLRRLGHRTFRSGVGANLGCTDDMVARLIRRIEHVAATDARRVVLIGHSRGGMLVKLAALRRPDLVAGVVVLSAPVTGTLSVAAHVRKQLEWLFRLNARGMRAVIGEDCVIGECAGRIAEELTAPLADHISYTSVYSRLDGIIDWRTCLDPHAELVEVRASHTGMGTDASVLQIVADRLRAIAPAAAAA